MPEIKVIHVVPDLRVKAGGIAATLPALATALQAHGVESRFVTLSHDDDFPWVDRTICSPQTNFHRPRRLSRLIEEVLINEANEAGRGVLLHSHGLWSMLNHAALRASSRLNRPALISLHGMLLPWARQNKKLRKDLAWALYQRRDLRRAKRLHVTSAQEKRIAKGIKGVPAVVEIPFGVDLPAIAAPSPAETADRTLLFLGRLHPIKNLQTLISAFVEAAPKEWNLRLAGPDEDGYREVLEALVARLGAQNRVSFAGAVYGSVKERELAAAQALVLPSFTENFGAVVVEALAMGRPVIASQGTPWQILEDERCGWWVASDREGLSKGIDELVRTPPLALASMGERGRDLVKRNFSWGQVAEAMSRLYSDLLGPRANVASKQC